MAGIGRNGPATRPPSQRKRKWAGDTRDKRESHFDEGKSAPGRTGVERQQYTASTVYLGYKCLPAMTRVARAHGLATTPCTSVQANRTGRKPVGLTNQAKWRGSTRSWGIKSVTRHERNGHAGKGATPSSPTRRNAFEGEEEPICPLFFGFGKGSIEARFRYVSLARMTRDSTTEKSRQ